MNMQRFLKHLMTGSMAVKAAFPARSMNASEQAIRESESKHAGQICFAVEAALDLPALRRKQSAAERGVEVFSQLRVWDTEHNNGVLIYLLLADHDVEIIADRGIHAKLGSAAWEAICREMEAAFRLGKFEAGVIHGINTVGNLLQQHFPRPEPELKNKSSLPVNKLAVNELTDKPVVL